MGLFSSNIVSSITSSLYLQFIRQESIRMAMDTVPDMPEMNTKDEPEKETITEEESDKESTAQANVKDNTLTQLSSYKQILIDQPKEKLLQNDDEN